MPHRCDPAKAVLMLDLLSEFFDTGRYWLRGNFHDDNGRRCLVDALRHLRARSAIVEDGTRFYLCKAQPQWIYKPITRFNDMCGSFEDIRALIDQARSLVEAELDAVRAAPWIRLAA